MNGTLLAYYRCPDSCAVFKQTRSQFGDPGFFRWGHDTICYGRSGGVASARRAEAAIYDAQNDIEIRDSSVSLPFDPEEVTENLLRERYSAHFREPNRFSNVLIRKTYYRVRPYLSVPVRKQLQKLYLRNWDTIAFPEWPVDLTVDRVQQRLMVLAIQAQGVKTMPFIWFWPDGCTGCAIITHDVEAAAGKEYCQKVMDIDESFGFRSSFQIVPEERYSVSQDDLAQITTRGFEVNVHDLKHDGRLYAECDEFLRRA